MKNIVTFFLLFVAVLFLSKNFSGCQNHYATKSDLDSLERRVKKEIILNRKHIILVERNIDTLKFQVRDLQANQDTIKFQLYQLQSGQMVIFDAIVENPQSQQETKQDFLQKLSNFLNLE